MQLSRSVKTSDATPVQKYRLQPLISGFMALIRATVGEPTCVRQSPFKLLPDLLNGPLARLER
jgi:hypothetical protein